MLGGIHGQAVVGYEIHLASRSGTLGRIHLWRATRRDPLASRSGGILGGINWRAALAGYSAKSTGEPLWRNTRRDPLASCSGGILGGIHWQAALAGYSAGSTGEPLLGGIHRRAATRRDRLASHPLASSSGGILGGIHLRAASAGYWAGSTGEQLWRDSAGSTGEQLWRDSAGSTGELLWRDTGRDSLASSSGGILGGIHLRAASAGYWAGSTGEQLWQDSAGSTGEQLWRDSAGSTGELLWRDTGGVWCRSIANADPNLRSNNPPCRVGKKGNTNRRLPTQMARGSQGTQGDAAGAARDPGKGGGHAEEARAEGLRRHEDLGRPLSGGRATPGALGPGTRGAPAMLAAWSKIQPRMEFPFGKCEIW